MWRLSGIGDRGQRPLRRWSATAGAIGAGALGLLLAGCGGGGAKVAAAGTQPISRTGPTTAGASSGTVTVVRVNNAKFGPLLADGKGRTLYTYTADANGKVGCTGVCLHYWPPLLLPSGQTAAAGGPGVTGLGAVVRPYGRQVTYRGQPLYTYVTDTRAGQTTGEGVVDAGGKWLVALVGSPTPSGAAATTVPRPATTIPTPGAGAPVGTTPRVTAPPATAPPVTGPPVTRPPVTAPPVTSPPATRPPVTTPPPPPTTARTTPPTPTTSPPGPPSY